MKTESVCTETLISRLLKINLEIKNGREPVLGG